MPTLNLHQLENIEHVIYRERKQLPLVRETIEIEYINEDHEIQDTKSNILTDSVQVIHVENDIVDDENVIQLTPVKRKYFGNSVRSSPIIHNNIENIHMKNLKKVKLIKIEENLIEKNSKENRSSMYI